MILSSLNEAKYKLLDLAKKPGNKAILTHTNPDADGVCAAFALKEILKNYDIRIDIVLETLLSDKYPIPDCNNEIKLYSPDLKYSTLIILDCHEKERVGQCTSLFNGADRIMAIDHHIAGAISSKITYFIDPGYVSVGAILYQMFRKELKSYPQSSLQYIATAVYGSIINDTDNFINSNVDQMTFEICAELMQYNIDPGRITETILACKTVAEVKFTGEVLSTLKTCCNGRVLFLHSTIKMLEKNGLDPETNSKMTKWVKGIKGVELIIFFQEEKDQVKLSLRSKSIDVNMIATKFGGGGHVKASGCTIKGNLEDVKSLLLTEISTFFSN